MAFAPGLRFQITLVLGGLAALSFGLVAVMVLPTYLALDEKSRHQEADQVATALAFAADVRCAEQDAGCVQALLDRFGRGQVVSADTGGAARVPSLDLAIVVDPGEPRPAVKQAQRVLFIFLGLDFGIIMLIGLIAFFRAIVRPVEAISQQADDLARLEFPALSTRGHQVGRLGASFRRMVSALSEEQSRVRKKIEELEAANRQLTEMQATLIRSEKLATVGRLSAGVAHEIGNPLGGLVGYLEILKSKFGDDSELGPIIEGSLTAASKIDRTIRELLDFARPSAEQITTFSVPDAVDEALRLVTPQKRFAGVKVHRPTADAAPPVRADHARVTQVLVNLFLNAADAMEGSGELDVSVAHTDGLVEITVADRGPGLPAGAEDDIFEPFFTTKAPGRGTGLGLAICSSIVEAWGGTIVAENREDGGAAFTLTIPAASPSEIR